MGSGKAFLKLLTAAWKYNRKFAKFNKPFWSVNKNTYQNSKFKWADTNFWDFPKKVATYLGGAGATVGTAAVGAGMVKRRRSSLRSRRPSKKAKFVRRSRKRSRVPSTTSRRVKRRITKKGTKKRARPTDNGTSGDRTVVSRKYGKRASVVSRTSKIAAATSTSIIYRLQGVLQYNATQGFYSMQRTPTGTPGTDNSAELMPLYLVELTNRAFTGASIPADAVESIFQLRKNYLTSGGNNTDFPYYDFVPKTTQNGAGASITGSYSVEKAFQDPALNSNRYHFLEWVDIRLDCISPTSIPCKWTVQIVQFKEDFLDPYSPVDTAPVAGTQEYRDITQRNQFWDNQTYKLIAHPFMSDAHGTNQAQLMKVLHSQSWIGQPKQSTDLFTSGDERMLRIFKYMNRLVDYGYTSDVRGPTPGGAGAETMGFAQDATTQLMAIPEAKKRIFLMIKAENFLISGGVTVTPTFDLIVRKKHMTDLN